MADIVRLGLGAPIPKYFYDDDQKLRRDISSVDLFKRRFLGLKRKARENPHQHKPRHRSSIKSQVESDSEEEEGRSALGRSKRLKTKDTKSPEGGKEKGAKEERKVHPTTSTDRTLDWTEGCVTNPKLADDHHAITKNLAGKGSTKKKRKKGNNKVDPTPSI